MKIGFILVVGLMIMVVVSLVRGIAAFLASAKADLDRDPSDGPSALQMKQNQMMFARIKYQALAIIAIVVVLMLNR